MSPAPRQVPAVSGFVPNFCGPGLFFGIVLGGQLLAFVLLLAMGWPADQMWDRLSLLSLFVLWILLVSVALLCLLRERLGQLGPLGEGLAAWLVCMVTTWGAAELAVIASEAWPGALFGTQVRRGELVLRSLGISGILGALALRYFYLGQQWRAQQLARAEARYHALQARIRPHFLFNSMNTIASLTRSDPARAEAVVEDLADLFRAALGNASGQSTLGEELELVAGYLRVEQLRLGTRLRVQWDLEPLPQEAPLPLLTLQPLVEYAVYHGIEPQAKSGVIRIAGRHRNGRVNISVRNSLPPDDAVKQREGNRVALDNVAQRLRALFQDRASMTLSRVEDEFQVRIVFPYP